MTEQHSDVLQYFISPRAGDSPDGTPTRPFKSLEQAMAAIGGLQASQGTDLDDRQYELVCLDQPGTARPIRKARYTYYIDSQSTGRDANGTEQAPWSDLESAVVGLTDLHRKGKLSLSGGQMLRLTRRRMFTSTHRERKRGLIQLLASTLFMGMAYALVIPVVCILGFLLIKAWPGLTWEFLSTNPSNGVSAGGILLPMIGTFLLVLVSLIISAPIGIMAGIYLNEYASDNWFTRTINLAVVNLAGVPSVVHGLFGFGAFVLFARLDKSLLAASCTVAIMTLPVIITSTKEALGSVPRSFREACWNLGATRWQTIRTIVLPNSIAGILTGVILQVSRAAGETAPILFTGVASLYIPTMGAGLWDSVVPYGLGDRFMALSYHLYFLSTSAHGASEELKYGTAVVLIGMVLMVNALSIGFRVYLRSRKKW